MSTATKNPDGSVTLSNTTVLVPSLTVTPPAVLPPPMTVTPPALHSVVLSAADVAALQAVICTPTPPTALTIVCPGNVQQSSPSGSIAVTFPPGTASGGTAPYVITSSPQSGSMFAVGSTVVTQTVTDAQGQTAQCSFTVTVAVVVTPPPTGTIILDDFTSTRMNGDTPPVPLFSPYMGASFPEGAGQVVTIGGGHLTLKVVNGMYLQFSPYPYKDPLGFAHGRTMAGTWPAGTGVVNRMYVTFTPPKSIAARIASSGLFQFGTYSKDVSDTNPSNQGDHYYHFLNGRLDAGRSVTLVLNNVPTHRVEGTGYSDPNPTYSVNPTMVAGQHNGPNHDYFYGMTRFYFGDQYANGLAGNWLFEPFSFGRVDNEPDTYVNTIMASYTGTQYYASWQGGRNVVWKYDVYLSSTSAHAAGNLSGSTKIGSSQTRGDTYVAVEVTGPAQAQLAGGAYLQIVPLSAPGGQFSEVFVPNR